MVAFGHISNFLIMKKYHRYFIQYMLENGVSTLEKAWNFCEFISNGEVESITHLKTIIIEINREISQQYYKIVFHTCEVTGQEEIVWLNTKNDDISKFQLTYSSLELEYFHSILQEIINCEDHRITFPVCINITSTLTASFSRDNGQKVLARWLEGGYFIKKDAHIYLGPRLILEFTSYLKSQCPNSLCNLCSELVFAGKQCSSCQVTLHAHCLTKFLNNQNQCPSCQNVWIRTDESEEAANEVEKYINEEESLEEELDNTDSQTRFSRRNADINKSQNKSDDADKRGPSTRKRPKRKGCN